MPPHRKAPTTAIHPFDQTFGTDTSGLLPGTQIAQGTGFPPEDLTAYYGVAPSILEGVLDLWLRECGPEAPIGETVFLDVGAGKGRALMLASRYPFRRVEGVELNPALASIARENLALWSAHPRSEVLAPAVLHEGDATAHPFGPEPVLAYLFHPFESRLLRRFLDHARESLLGHPRPFDLIYVNAEHDPVLDRNPAVRRLWIGRVPMSAADHLADVAAIAQQAEYGSTGDEVCAIYRLLATGANHSQVRRRR